MKYPKLRELREAIKAVIKGPYTTRFPYEPHIPEKRFRGRPVPDKDGCIGCGACAEVCPAVAIEVIDEVPGASAGQSGAAQPTRIQPTRRVIWHYDQCIFCAQCERLCTTQKGVKLSNKEFDMACFDRKTLFADVQKELVVCEHCGEIIATEDQLRWIAEKLKHQVYGNFLEFSYLQKFLGIGGQAPSGQLSSRNDLFNLVCPKCRRHIHLLDEYGK
ncbi:MAG: 4Fe-4S dicluster domain-containing protein [Elusimicrobia bacterium]|nr:4Fe-4S dicluster domain-containing protein [Elusimicrobiota bacterium]